MFEELEPLRGMFEVTMAGTVRSRAKDNDERAVGDCPLLVLAKKKVPAFALADVPVGVKVPRMPAGWRNLDAKFLGVSVLKMPLDKVDLIVAASDDRGHPSRLALEDALGIQRKELLRR